MPHLFICISCQWINSHLTVSISLYEHQVFCLTFVMFADRLGHHWCQQPQQAVSVPKETCWQVQSAGKSISTELSPHDMHVSDTNELSMCFRLPRRACWDFVHLRISLLIMTASWSKSWQLGVILTVYFIWSIKMQMGVSRCCLILVCVLFTVQTTTWNSLGISSLSWMLWTTEASHVL